MPKTENIALYECDRCHRQEYIKDGGDTSKWLTISRIDINGQDYPALLCDTCYTLYAHLLRKQEQDYQHFMANEED